MFYAKFHKNQKINKVLKKKWGEGSIKPLFFSEILFFLIKDFELMIVLEPACKI